MYAVRVSNFLNLSLVLSRVKISRFLKSHLHSTETVSHSDQGAVQESTTIWPS